MDRKRTLILAISETIRDIKKIIQTSKHPQKLCKIPKFEGPGSKIKPTCLVLELQKNQIRETYFSWGVFYKFLLLSSEPFFSYSQKCKIAFASYILSGKILTLEIGKLAFRMSKLGQN